MQHENTFRLATSHGREYLLQAGDESNMNQWVSLINWAAASKTLGIPTTSLPFKEDGVILRSMGMNNTPEEDVALTPKVSHVESAIEDQSHRTKDGEFRRQASQIGLGDSLYPPVRPKYRA